MFKRNRRKILILEDHFGNKVLAYHPKTFYVGEDDYVVIDRSGKMLSGSDTKKYRVGKVLKINGKNEYQSYTPTSYEDCRVALSFSGGCWDSNYVYRILTWLNWEDAEMF